MKKEKNQLKTENNQLKKENDQLRVDMKTVKSNLNIEVGPYAYSTLWDKYVSETLKYRYFDLWKFSWTQFTDTSAFLTDGK